MEIYNGLEGNEGDSLCIYKCATSSSLTRAKITYIVEDDVVGGDTIRCNEEEGVWFSLKDLTDLARGNLLAAERGQVEGGQDRISHCGGAEGD